MVLLLDAIDKLGHFNVILACLCQDLLQHSLKFMFTEYSPEFLVCTEVAKRK